MKEILFRGKTLDTKEWVYGYFVNCSEVNKPYSNAPEIIESTARFVFKGSYEMPKVHRVDINTVGQFIGAIDKYGKKIFEGDILEYYGGIGECSIKSFVVLGERFLIHNGAVYSLARGFDYIVVGNIFDNPELVDEKTKRWINENFLL